MATHSGARFKIETSASTDGGYDATESTTINLQLEASPASDVATCTYSVPIVTAGAPAPTLSNGGIADPPTDAVQLTLGAGSHSYLIKCQTNGGEAVPGIDGKPDRTVNTFYRVVSVRTTSTGLRLLIVGETLQYDTIEGWVGAINEMARAIETVSSAQASLAATQWVQTTLKTGNHTAVAWQHVLVDLDGASADVTISLPASTPETKESRVRVSEVSADGGVSSGYAVKIAGTFAATAGGHFATSPYIVANNGSGQSKRGANVELLDTGAGWLVVQEGCQPPLAP